MGPVRKLAHLGPLVLACCGSSDLVVVPSPDPKAQTLVVRWKDQIFAKDLLDGTPLNLQIESEEQAEGIAALAYSEPLNTLGLMAGNVTLETCRSCNLLEPDLGAYELDGQHRWQPATRLDHGLMEVLVPDADRCGPCDRFEGELLPLPDPQGGWAAGATRYSDTEVLVVQFSTKAALVDDRGNMTPVCSLPPTGALFYAGGRVVAVTSSRTLTRYEISFDLEPCQIVDTIQTPTILSGEVAITGSPDGRELVIASASGGVVHIIDDEVTLEAEFEAGDPRIRGAAWMKPGHFAALGGSTQVAVAAGGPAVTRTLEYEGTRVLATTLGVFESTYVLGTDHLGVLTLSGSDVRSLGNTHLEQGIRATTTWEGGILSVNRDAVLRQYPPNDVCEPQLLEVIPESEVTIDAMYTLGESFVIPRLKTARLARFVPKIQCAMSN